MRKLLFAGVVAFAGLGIASASANVFVTGSILKIKNVRIIENITITKTVNLTAVVDVVVDKAAESEALINQTNFKNKGCGNCAEKLDSIIDSFNGNMGVLVVHQAAGNMNNQAAAIAAAIDFILIPGDGNGGNNVPPETTGELGFAEAQAAVEQRNGVRFYGIGLSVNHPDEGNTVDAVNLLFRTAEIKGSFNDNQGIVMFDQAAGNMANQANALSLAVSFKNGGVALSEADLGQFNQFNTVFESDLTNGDVGVGITKLAKLSGSMLRNKGIVMGNQSSGNMANQANVVGFAAVQLPGGGA